MGAVEAWGQALRHVLGPLLVLGGLVCAWIAWPMLLGGDRSAGKLGFLWFLGAALALIFGFALLAGSRHRRLSRVSLVLMLVLLAVGIVAEMVLGTRVFGLRPPASELPTSSIRTG